MMLATLLHFLQISVGSLDVKHLLYHCDFSFLASLKECFEKWGEVESVNIKFDQVTKQSRLGFVFLSFSVIANIFISHLNLLFLDLRREGGPGVKRTNLAHIKVQPVIDLLLFTELQKGSNRFLKFFFLEICPKLWTKLAKCPKFWT